MAPPSDRADDGDAAVARAEGPVRRAPVLLGLLQAFLFALVGVALVDVVYGRVDSDRNLSADSPLEPAEYLVWKNRPGFTNETTRISSLGLRSAEIPADAPAEELRVLGVGPSLVYGGGPDPPHMDRVWAPFLEQRLHADVGGEWRVLNGGVNGYSTVQAARWALQLLPRVEPDLVLLFVTPGRISLLDPSGTRKSRPWRGRPAPNDLLDRWPEPLLPAVLAVHDLLMARSSLYVRHRRSGPLEGHPDHVHRFMLGEHLLDDPWVQDGLARTFAEIEMLAEGCAERGVELRVVQLLDGVQYSSRRWNIYLSGAQQRGAPPIRTKRTEPQRLLGELLDERGLAWWTLQDAMSVLDARHHWTLSDRIHWSADGHELVAGALLEELVGEAGLLDLLRSRRAAAPRGSD